jgi:transposase-like protein
MTDAKPLARDERPSVACPHCEAHTAQVRGVSTAKDGIVNITMFCKDCDKSWIVQKETFEDAPPA